MQTIKVDEKYDLEIKKIDEQYSFDLKSLAVEKGRNELYKLESPKNDLIISGNGYFAFSQDSFFDPEIIKTIDLTELDDLENIDYVLTTLSQAKENNDWLTTEAFFDLKNIKIDDDELYFSLEVPDLNNYGGELEIDYLEIEINGGGFLAKKEVKEEKEIGENEDIFSSISHKIKGAFNKQEDVSEEKPTSAPTPTPTIAIEKISLPVKILNGGAEKGTAGRFVKVLAENGFINTQAANADSYDYQDAIVRYRKQNKKEADKITELLMKDYQTIQQDEIATSSPDLVVILGGR